MTRDPILFVALATLLTACTDTLLDPSALQQSIDGRDSIFATGSEEEQRLAEDLAYGFLDDNEERVLAGIFGVATDQVQIRNGLAHVRIDQELDGLPVFGAQSIVHLDEDGEVIDMTDGWEHGVDLDTTPRVLQADALEQAVLKTGGWDNVSDYPQAVLGVLRHDSGDHLVYRVRIPRLDGSDRSSIPVVFVDAHDGKVVWSYDDLQTATCTANTAYNGAISFPCDSTSGGYRTVSASKGTGTWSARNASTTSSTSIYDVVSSGTNFTVDNVAADAHFGVVSTLDYYAQTFGRNGIDGNGGPDYKEGLTTAVVHYGNRYANAYWDGTRMVFGDGDNSWLGPLTSLDIAGHELTHGVTEHTAGLIYSGQSGALNESMSDVFGAMVEYFVEGPGNDIWDIGEDAWTPGTSGDALRYMDNPHQDGDSADHMSNIYTGSADNGGVHTNSGLPNLVFYLVAQGGHHPRLASVNEVPGIGVQKASAIWYAALTEWMTASTNFAGARTATVNAAKALYGNNSPEVFSVEAAWAEVGVGSPPAGNTPTDPGTPTDPQPTGDNLNLTGLSATSGNSLTYTIEVPEGATNLVFNMSGGTGDADMYIRKGSAPTDSAYDCRPYKNGNNETCTFAAPAAGTWHVRVKAYSTFSGVSLTSSYDAPTTTPDPTPTGPDLDLANLSDAKNGEQRWTVDVPAGTSSLTVRITGGTGDADLYLKKGSAPTTSSYDCRPYKNGNEETCTVTNPASGTYHIMLRAYAAYTGVHLTAN
ncbi:MAG: M4 family metallopeptidase [Alphaproteobacteria bacterium]|nr:M4 family metallopeptidase [Alphaproteobacteria bacterium]